MLRCCQGRPDDFEPSYASVLVAGNNLRRAVEDVETDCLMCPCVTAWCGRCKRSSFLVGGRAGFPAPSAFFAHALRSRELFEGTFREHWEGGK
jgi:hypothetical protein